MLGTNALTALTCKVGPQVAVSGAGLYVALAADSKGGAGLAVVFRPDDASLSGPVGLVACKIARVAFHFLRHQVIALDGDVIVIIAEMVHGDLATVVIDHRRWGLKFVTHKLLLHLGLIPCGDCTHLSFELEKIGGTGRTCHVETRKILGLDPEAPRRLHCKRDNMAQHLLTHPRCVPPLLDPFSKGRRRAWEH
jgi:hypothetical protein